MEFVGVGGPCVLVDASSAGQRLQGFVARAFREQLGRCADREFGEELLVDAEAVGRVAGP